MTSDPAPAILSALKPVPSGTGFLKGMNKRIVVFFLLILILLVQGRPVFAEDVEAKKMDSRAKILAKYLSNFDSPLQNHAQDFIDAADTYKLDWKMLPAIAGVESTFGKFIPGGFNAWGWGVYGNQAIYFSSWKKGIFTIAKGLRENYLDKGLNDPYAINRIYAASPTWGSKVAFFMQDLEKFTRQVADNTAPALPSLDKTSNIAAVSGQIASK